MLLLLLLFTHILTLIRFVQHTTCILSCWFKLKMFVSLLLKSLSICLSVCLSVQPLVAQLHMCCSRCSRWYLGMMMACYRRVDKLVWIFCTLLFLLFVFVLVLLVDVVKVVVISFKIQFSLLKTSLFFVCVLKISFSFLFYLYKTVEEERC